MRIRVCVLAALLALALPAWPASKEIIQLQRDVALLQEQIRELNRLITERLAVMTSLVERNTDAVNKLQGSIDNAQRAVQSSVAGQGQKIDTLQSHFQALGDALEDLKARQARLSEQMAQVRQLVETIQTPPPAAQQAQSQPTAPPPPKDLYENALRDYMGGKNDLAVQGFQDYLKYYSDTDLAGNAQFYIGEIFYRTGKYSDAVKAYNVVLDNFPNGNKTAAAHLKKGYALLEMKQREAAVRELRALIRRFPNSEEARLARERLKSLGLTAAAPSARSPTAARRSLRSRR